MQAGCQRMGTLVFVWQWCKMAQQLRMASSLHKLPLLMETAYWLGKEQGDMLVGHLRGDWLRDTDDRERKWKLFTHMHRCIYGYMCAQQTRDWEFRQGMTRWKPSLCLKMWPSCCLQSEPRNICLKWSLTGNYSTSDNLASYKLCRVSIVWREWVLPSLKGTDTSQKFSLHNKMTQLKKKIINTFFSEHCKGLLIEKNVSLQVYSGEESIQLH